MEMLCSVALETSHNLSLSPGQSQVHQKSRMLIVFGWVCMALQMILSLCLFLKKKRTKAFDVIVPSLVPLLKK